MCVLPHLKIKTIFTIKEMFKGQAQSFMLVILTIWEAKIRGILVQGQPRQKVHMIPSQPIKAAHSGT
jgi:hypothetical protein